MTDEKIEWRKEEAGFSLRKKPQILTIPAQNYFSIKGNGDPNLPDFSEASSNTLSFILYNSHESKK